ncbi:response regulator transcription factor [Pedobacter sp. SYP-B3415]|uniref:response regulator transcription factor n=1 Tax=Pedobacter sp. SYP-B3415 TaxID=2496641 RepID=UPI00101B96E2|nr:helix-turn-helix transcriptional regulator [Pedobacter sp. SYP-B3415]
MTDHKFLALIDAILKKHIPTFESMPGTVIVHELRSWHVVYMTENGRNQLGITLDELRAMDNEEYHRRYFNPDDAADYVPKLAAFIAENNADDSITYFQQVRTTAEGKWNWHMAATRILARDDKGLPLLCVTTAAPIDAMHHMSAKAERLLEENNFLRQNLPAFSRLGKREKEILRLMARGKSSNEIAEQLFISSATVDTHRRNIRTKLGVNTHFELSQYARAFDLI